MKPTLTDAGNTLVPAYLAILQRGFLVHKEPSAVTESGTVWIAENADREFFAEDLVMLLGRISMYESRGPSWQASDEEIDRFTAEFGVP
ncbi:MAG: hypothetical protein WCJ09_02820 [Planctomycetota bacterium]